MGTVLNVAAELGLGVHVGLAMTTTPLFTAHGIAMNTTTLAQYTSLCKGIGHGVWTAYGAKHASTIHGWCLGCYNILYGGSVNNIHGSSNKIHVLRTKIRVLFVF